MKDSVMIQSPKFEVNLGGIDLSEKQAQELEKAIQQTTLQFLAKLDNGFTNDLLAYKPDPNNDRPVKVVGPIRIPEWWFGFIVWKQPRPGQLVQLDRIKAIFSLPDHAANGAFEKVQTGPVQR